MVLVKSLEHFFERDPTNDFFSLLTLEHLLMTSLPWSRLSPVRNLHTSPVRILPWMAE